MAGRERLLGPDRRQRAGRGHDPPSAAEQPARADRRAADNTKPDAATLLAGVASGLKRAHGLRASVLYTKSCFGTPAEESLLQRILRNCDFAVAGIGD